MVWQEGIVVNVLFKRKKEMWFIVCFWWACSWESFTKQMQSMWRNSDIKGHELRKASASIYTYPAPDCMCSKSYVQYATNVLEEAHTGLTNNSSSQIL